MMARTQITLETEMQRRARQRASDLGVSVAEYFRRLVARDLARPETTAQVDRIFDLGSSGGSDIASQKDSVIAEAFHSRRMSLLSILLSGMQPDSSDRSNARSKAIR